MIGRLGLAALALSAAVCLIAATPAPSTAPPANTVPQSPPGAPKLTKAQLDAMAPPTVHLETVYLVSTNKLGQVTGANPQTLSKNKRFNVQTLGNALQAFIRTSDGKAISGMYSLTYEYDPKTQRITRSVALVHAGGVDPNAKGAALVMLDVAQKEAAAAAAKAKHSSHASPAPHTQASPH